MRLYRRAADQGYAIAQYNLGLCFDNGIGVAVDKAAAARLWRLASDQGHAPSQVILSDYYFRGVGVAADAAKAVELFRRAADSGDAAAQFNLGHCNANGTGVAHDDAAAAAWWRRAAEQGHAGAQFNLGCCFANGDGVAANDAAACGVVAQGRGAGAARCHRAAGAAQLGRVSFDEVVVIAAGRSVCCGCAGFAYRVQAVGDSLPVHVATLPQGRGRAFSAARPQSSRTASGARYRRLHRRRG